MQRPNFRGHQLTPNTKPLINKQSNFDANQSNLSNINPSKHPLDLSGRNRNLSLNDLRPSPGRVQVRSSMMRQSTHIESNDYASKILSKLKERIDELQKQNKSLYDLNLEYEQQRNLWQEKAKRLNQQLVRYEDRDLHAKSTNSQIQINQQGYQHQIKQYQRILLVYEENNKSNQRKVSSLSAELDRLKIEAQKPKEKNNQMESIYNDLKQDYQQVKRKFQMEQMKNRQNEQEIYRLEEQLSFMTKEIPQKINLIQQQKKELNDKLVYQRASFNKQITELKKHLMHERQQKETCQQQNIKSKRQITILQESKYKVQQEVQSINEQVIKLKQLKYQQQIKFQDQIMKQEKQYNRQKKQMRNQLSSLKNQIHSLKQTIFDKNMHVQQLQVNIRHLSEQMSYSKSIQIQQQKNAASALIIKNMQSQNITYRRQNQMLNATVESLRKEINDLQTSYIKQRNESHQDIQHLQRRIRDIQSMHEQEKRQLLTSVDLDITDLGNLVKGQEKQIAEIHQKYCLQIDKIIAENTLLKKNHQLMQVQFNEQRAFLEGRINESKEYSYASQTLKMQVQQLSLQLQQQKSASSQLMQDHLIAEEKYHIQLQKINELNIQIRGYQSQIQHLHQQNQKWRSYRKSQEEDARKECRRYKKRIQQLQQQQQGQNVVLVELQTFQTKCLQLKSEMIEQQKEYKRCLQDQKVKLSQAIDQMETQMRKILKEWDCEKISRQQEITKLRQLSSMQLIQLQEISEINHQLKISHQSSYSINLDIQTENQRLKKQLVLSKNDVVKIQNLLKKQESDNISLKYSSETQKDFIKNRYDKDMQQKVTQIQRLKLEVNQLSQELKVSFVGRKQIETLQIALKNKETEERQASQRCKYLQNMIDTYLGEIKGLKAMRQKDCAEKRKLQETVSSLQRKISQIQNELNGQTTRLNRINEQRHRQYLKDLKQLKDKNGQLTSENRKLQANIYQANAKQKETSRLIKEQQNKIMQLNKEIHSESMKYNRAQQDKINQYQGQINDWKDKYQYVATENNRIQSKLNQAHLTQKNKEKQIRQKDFKLNELNEIIKKSKSQIQDLKQKCDFLQERLNSSTKEAFSSNQTKKKQVELQQKQASYKSVVEDQKQKIESLCKDQSQKLREIQILISKINLLQTQLVNKSSKTTQTIQIDTNKSKRVQCYLNMCNLNLLGNNTCKLRYDGDEQLFLRVVVETLKTLNNRLTQSLSQISNKQKTIAEMSEQKENLNNKYLKYKAFAIQYKQKKQMQKYVLKNTYRFNEEIINHCQDIIKSDRK